MLRPLPILTVLTLTAWTLLAQPPTAVGAAPGTAAPATAAGAAAPAIVPDLALAEAHCRNGSAQPTNGNAQSKICEPGDTLAVTFTNLREWMADPKNKPSELVLVLDGRVMKGLTPRGPDTQYKELAFDLKRLDGDQPDSKANRDAWNALLSRAKSNLTISVGVALGGNPPYFGPAAARMQVFPSYSWLIVVFLFGLLVVFFLLAHKSDILRDAPSPPGGPKLAFSLGRCQMAFWFFVILAAYNYIWMVTGDRDSLTSGALILMGISAATAMGALVVDSSKRDQRQSLANEQTALLARLATLPSAIAAVSAAAADPTVLQTEQIQKQARVAQVNTALGNLPSPPGASEGFLLDILRDETGVSFHRFQMAGWTIVLGFVFVVGVYQSLAMPDFSATLLGLMGISAGTYVGFKIPDPPK
jgi:hypothetical protein